VQILLYLKLILSAVSLFFIGYLPVYFLLLKDSNSAMQFRNIAGRFFIFFISFYIGIFISSVYLMVLSLLGFKYNLLHIILYSLIFFIFSLYFLISREIRIAKSRNSQKSNNPENLVQNNAGIFNSNNIGIETRSGSKLKSKFSDKSINIFNKIVFSILLFFTTFNFLVVLFFALLFPIRFWDAISCWSLKGRAFFIDRSIIPFYTSHQYQFSHLSYPLYLPLTQTWIYLWLGRINENLVKIIFPIFYLSVLFIFYYLFRKRFNKIITMALVFVFSALPVVMDHGYIEYTNLLYSIIFAMAVFFFFISLTLKSTGGKERFNYLMLAAIFFTILAYIRSEGLLFLILFMVINFIIHIVLLIKKPQNSIKTFYKDSLINILVPIFLSFLLMLPWIILKIRLNIPVFSTEWVPVLQNGITGSNAFNIAEASGSLSSELLFSSFDSIRAFLGSSYGVMWIILLFIFIFNVKKLVLEFKWIFFIFIIFGFITLFFSLGLVEDFNWSTDRYILHILPLTYLWIFYNLPVWYERKY
jgi:hypothetical protein